MKNAIALLLIFASQGCSYMSDDKFDSGYSDGYAVGYNTTCKIRATLVEGDWDNKNYATGYEEGYADGSADCISR